MDKEIKILLLKKDIRQADIARRLHVSKASVCNVIKGVRESARIKAAIARALGTKVEDLWPENSSIERRNGTERRKAA